MLSIVTLYSKSTSPSKSHAPGPGKLRQELAKSCQLEEVWCVCVCVEREREREGERERERERERETHGKFNTRLSQRECVECLIGKQKKPILFKVTEPSSIPYRTHSAYAKMAANPDPPPVIPLPESIAAQAAYQLRYKNTEY